MRVLMVAYYFPPLGGIGSVRAASFARDLPDAGWTPVVLAPRDGAYHRDPSLQVSGEVIRSSSVELSRFGKRMSFAGGDDVSPATVVGWRTWMQRLARRHLYFPDSKVGWVPDALWVGSRHLRKEPVDAVWSSSFPISAHVIARRLAKRAGVPWIAEFRDPWSDMLPPNESARAARLEQAFLRDASAVVTTSANWAELYRAKGARRCVVMTNGFDQRTPAAPKGAGTRLALLGSMYPGLLDTATLWHGIARHRAATNEPVSVSIVGVVSPEVQDEWGVAGIADICRATGFLPHHEAAAQLASASVAILSGPRDGDRRSAGRLPAKVFEYLATDVPIVCVAHASSDVAKILDAVPGTFVVPPGDVAGCARAIGEAVRLGRVERERESRPFRRDVIARDLALLLDELCTDRDGR
jgi:glycosyltransferase involved in cell wall biosynthesis